MKASLVEPPTGPGLREDLLRASPPVVRVDEARGFLARARGLLARPVLAPGCGLLLRNVRAVHGFGMRHAIDLVFLDERWVVVRCATLAPWQTACCAGARHVLEMAAGEAARLKLRQGVRPMLLPGALIFRCGAACAHSGCRPLSGAPLLRVPLLRGLLLVLLLSAAVSASEALGQTAPAPAASRAAPSSPSSAAAGRSPDVEGSLDPRALRRLEVEADLLYRDSRPNDADEELLTLYRSLATATPQRAYQAWLRIGNIHQRAGAVGAAIDAYRLALQADAAMHGLRSDEEDARRKSLLNLASMALEQARQALAALPSLPATAEQAGQLQSLQRQYEARQAGRGEGDRSAAGAGHADAAAPAGTPQFIERYTASGRRNAVKSARGSLHLHPADDLPAKPVPKPRSRHRPDPLPDVEYLLGDPQRFAPAVDAHAPDSRRRKAAAPGKAPATGRADKASGGAR